jgi:hypothetical protein
MVVGVQQTSGATNGTNLGGGGWWFWNSNSEVSIIMAHFAKVKDGIVTKVIVAEQEFIDNLIDNEAGKWIQTSYNT